MNYYDEQQSLREDLGTGYGLRFSAEIYGSKRFSTNTYRKLGFVLTEITGNLREFTGECNPGILCFNSLLPLGLEVRGRRAYTIIYYNMLYDITLYYTILYYTILYYTILYYTILYYTILYYTILYYTILYYTVLY